MANEDVTPQQVQEYLEGSEYPASKQELVNNARDNGAPDEVISRLQQLTGQRYDNPTDVSQELGAAA